MAPRHGVQAELLLSLALIMFTATALLFGTFLEVHRSQTRNLHSLLARGFVAESVRPGFTTHGLEGGHWWRVDRQGRLLDSSPGGRPLDEASLRLAQLAVDEGSPHVQSGSPWTPIRFASPSPDGANVLVGRLDEPLSTLALSGLILIDISVFGFFGVTLLRRRVVGPLARLAAAVRELGEGEGEGGASVPVEGAAEIAELAIAFNEMQEALLARTRATEKAVSELREANQRLSQAREGLDRAERLAMVGSMAAGVAHEVGNPMGALLSFLEVASQDPAMAERSRHCLDRATEQGERVRVILRQLLDFSRAPRIERGPFSLAEVADQVVELVAAQREFEDIRIEVIHPETGEQSECWGDRSLASQILLNLVLNAAHEVRDSDSAQIRLVLSAGYARMRDSDRDPVERREEAPDRMICHVEDSGRGVELDDPERIFDPFFTTRAPGEGTGLGLANARKLAEEMGGFVFLDRAPSELGGARFSLGLPRTESDGPAFPDAVRPRSDAAARTGIRHAARSSG